MFLYDHWYLYSLMILGCMVSLINVFKSGPIIVSVLSILTIFMCRLEIIKDEYKLLETINDQLIRIIESNGCLDDQNDSAIFFEPEALQPNSSNIRTERRGS